MEKTQQSSAQQQSPERDTGSTLFWAARMVAYGVGAVTGIRLGVTKVWDMFYDNFKTYPQFEDIRKERWAELGDVAKNAAANAWDRQKIAKEIRGIENKYGHAFNGILLNKFKIESEGFAGAIKGTWHRFNTFGGWTQAKIGFATVFSTLAAVGGLVIVERYATHKNSAQQKLYDDVQAHAQQRETGRA